MWRNTTSPKNDTPISLHRDEVLAKRLETRLNKRERKREGDRKATDVEKINFSKRTIAYKMASFAKNFTQKPVISYLEKFSTNPLYEEKIL